MKALPVAIIGLGVGEQHARAYARSQYCSVAWLCDLDVQRASALVAELGQGKAAADHACIMRDPSVKIVSIASYDDDHFEQTLEALAAGKHVFVEKPLCRSPEEARRIKAASLLSPHCHLECNLVLRSAPLYLWLRQMVQDGELGDIFAFDGEYLYGRIHKITDGWRKDVQDYSVMQGGGVHLVDLMLWITGQRPSAVVALGNRIATQGTAFRYSDFVAANYTFPSGLIGRITANFGCVHRHQHVVRIFGTKATFLYDDQGPRLFRQRNPEEKPQIIGHSPLPVTKGDLIADFVGRILDDSNTTTSRVQHELDVIAACLAADQSALSGQSKRIEYV